MLVVLAFAAALVLWLGQRIPREPDSGRAAAPSTSGPTGSLLTLPQRPSLPGYRPVTPESRPKSPPMAAAPPSPEAQMPPVPYRYAGRLGSEVLLAKDATVIAVARGEVLDGRYRVEAIDDKAVTLMYLPLARTVVIEIDSAASR